MIGNLYFVHQRGVYMSLIQFILGATSNFSSVVCGLITTNLGWKYLFHIYLALIGTQLLLLFFFCPETAYIRDHRLEIDEVSTEDLQRKKSYGGNHIKEKEAAIDKQAEESHTEHVDRTSSTSSPPATANPIHAPKTFWQRTAIFTGTYTDEGLLQLVIAPFAILLNLSILWVVVSSGALTALFVAVSYVLAQIFTLPPYLLDTSGMGYLSLSPFIGGLLASLILGRIVDPTIAWATRRNGGIYEPEFRLLPIVGCLLTGLGLMVFGALAEEGRSLYATGHGGDHLRGGSDPGVCAGRVPGDVERGVHHGDIVQESGLLRIQLLRQRLDGERGAGAGVLCLWRGGARGDAEHAGRVCLGKEVSKFLASA